MKKLWTQKQKGFTIVELLIVVVVIGILAAITIVVYGGVQQRALNSARISAAVGYQKLITNYITTNGDYPRRGAFCLDGAGNDIDSDGILDCKVQSGKYNYNTSASNKIATIGTLPSYPDNPVFINSTNSADGIGYNWPGTRTLDGEASPLIILYNSDGTKQDCGVSPVLHYTATSNAYTSTGTTNYTSTNATSTYCFTTVTDPSRT